MNGVYWKEGKSKGIKGIERGEKFGRKRECYSDNERGQHGRGKEKWKGKDVKTWFGVSLTDKEIQD